MKVHLNFYMTKSVAKSAELGLCSRALMLGVQIVEEVKRMTGVDFREQMVKFFTTDLVQKILSDRSATKTIVEEATQSNVNSKIAKLHTFP
jgi:hypothetical protein